MLRPLLATVALLGALPAAAGVLPEERADLMYHRYDGGGVTIDGPSVLVRKNFKEKFSVSANYYVDMVSSASIDVVTTASPYEEQRTETSLGFDYLRGKTTYSLGWTNSEENDYTADTFSFSISQDIFGDLTTVTLGYAVADDEVRRRGDEQFAEQVDRQTYRLGLTQVLTKNLLMAVSYDVITDEGFLNNPYRSVRVLDPGGSTYSFEPEIYPNTRTSNAIGLRTRYFLPYRAAVSGGYRFFTDTWGIDAHTGDVGYTHPWGDDWTFDVRFRYYRQDAADFYADLFPRSQAQNFMARDKELSTFSSQTIRLGATYQMLPDGWKFVSKGSVSLFYDRIFFDYDDFRDLTSGATVGEEPMYSFEADVLQLFFSFWF